RLARALPRRRPGEQAVQLSVLHRLRRRSRRARGAEDRLGQQVAGASDGERSVRLEPALQAQADQYRLAVGHQHRTPGTGEPGRERGVRHLRPPHYVRQRGHGPDDRQAGVGRRAPAGQEDLREVARQGTGRWRLGGLACGWLVLRTSFAGTAEDRAATVGFWGFRGPLGAWVCIWGAFAMITSAPFDNWWHNAYGLDVKVLSPPHVILALGIWGIHLGSLF